MSLAMYAGECISAIERVKATFPPIARDDVIDAALARGGIAVDERAAALARADSAAIKDDLRARTDRAVAAGVFGAPAMIVRRPDKAPVLLWGQDRLDWLEAVLRGW